MDCVTREWLRPAGGTCIRKYVGDVKDNTTVSIAKVNDYKVMVIEFFQGSYSGSLIVAVVALSIHHHSGYATEYSKWPSLLRL
jgi:hypothetical protein